MLIRRVRHAHTWVTRSAAAFMIVTSAVRQGAILRDRVQLVGGAVLRRLGLGGTTGSRERF